MMVTETEDTDGNSTGWKLFRIPLISFDTTGTPNWDDVRSLRLRIESADIYNSQLLKIAKIELVENEWQELGVGPIDNLEINNLDKNYKFFLSPRNFHHYLQG